MASGYSLALDSSLYSKSDKYFYQEVNEKNVVINDDINTCKNALAILALVANKKNKLAKEVVLALYSSPLFCEKTGLFFRVFNKKKKVIDSSVITQSNLLLALALIKLKKIDKAIKIVRALERVYFNEDVNLFGSIDCLNESEDCEVHYFSDDQALAIIVYKSLGETDKAKKLLNYVLKSKLYDNTSGLFNRSFSVNKIHKTKTSYKNGLMGIALGKMEHREELDKLNDSTLEYLYDKSSGLFNFSNSDTTKIPDNSILALLSIDYHNLKHVIF